MNASRSVSLQALLDRAIKREGGDKIVEDPDDPGGLTKFGISQRAYPHLDIRNLTHEQACDIYERDYWAPFKGLGEERGEAVFDFGIHSGQVMAAKLAQRAVKVKEDGQIGDITMRAISAHTAAQFNRAFAIERIVYYIKVILTRPTSIKYAKGWVARALEFV